MTSPALRSLLEQVALHEAMQEVLRRFSSNDTSSISLSGLTTTAKALVLTLLAPRLQRPLVVVVDGNKQAEALHETVETFWDLLIDEHAHGRPQLLPAFDVLPYQKLSPHQGIAEARAVSLWRLASTRVPLTIAPIAAMLQRTEERDFYRQLALTLHINDEIALEDLVMHLHSIGYQKQEPVEMVGEYSVRGGIIDIFPAETAQPVRLEFFGDIVDSIRRFDPATQRSVLRVEDVTLLPLLEHPLSRKLLTELAAHASPDVLGAVGEPFPGWELLVPLVEPRQHSLLSLLDKPILIWDEPEQTASAAERFWKRLEDPERPLPFSADALYFRYEQLCEATSGQSQLRLRELDLVSPTDAGETSLRLATRPTTTFQGNVQRAIAETRQEVEKGSQVALFSASLGEVERLADLFREYSVPYQLGLPAGETPSQYLAERAALTGSAASTYLVKGCIRRGTQFPELGLLLYGTDDLFGHSELTAAPVRSAASIAAFQADIADLQPGDFVVHATHGVGKFLGIRSIPQGDQTGDFMLLEYAGESKLYVPLTRLDLVQKFRGSGESKPPVDRLGGVTWAKTKTRVKARMRDMADELLKLYAQRKLAEGFAFSADSNWQREFEDAFEYTITRDQSQAVSEIKRDMEDEAPMDRLLCGDVGFGKTEVAMRAAFKALGDGKQVAVLAPTTVLVLQHFETFKRRFASFPARIEMLSRFRSPKEMKQAIEDIAAGKVDVVIGTHRLLSQDVEFPDLGLLIVDEEQRFGVRHKERLKQMRRNVDVLTMSATPIPRTLHMSLLGLRDLSVIETPPKDRIAVHTVVAHENDELIRAAIEQELGRGGQVYYLHNRVDTIYMRAAHIQQLAPQARIGVGHGQMGETDLEKVLHGFMRHEFDVFVCTTIVENGLDIPLANTILIEHAEKYGLGELYQLRGRVGRSNRRAYAYLLIPVDTELSEIARKRLAALKEFSDLGAGFKIAALDLELRGAGNLLGGEQSGQIGTVGFDTYVRLLEEAVHELRGEEVPLEVHATLNLGLDIRIPADYVTDERQRLRAYKRVADAATPEAIEKVLGELTDRYGPAPEAVRTLAQFSRVKNLAQSLGVEAVDRRAGFFNVKFHPEARVDPERLMTLLRRTPQAQFTPAGVLRLPVPTPADAQQTLEVLASMLQETLGEPVAV